MSQTLTAGTAFDAVSLLGFGAKSTEPLPQGNPGEIVIRYGGWSLQELRAKRAPGLMWDQSWHDKYPWSSEKLPSGLYVLRLPIPDSNRKTFDQQEALLLPGEETAHVVLAASALLAIRLSGGDDPLRGDWTHCQEQATAGRRVVLAWVDGRLFVFDYFDGYPFGGVVWLSSARASA